jgi:hypothetical protein
MRMTMARLVARTRALARVPQDAFTDDDIQAALDRYCAAFARLDLTPMESTIGGSVVTLDYLAPFGDWEDGVVLFDGRGNVLVPASQDTLAGRWTFAVDQPPPVRLSGRTYDVNSAAADLVDLYVANLPSADISIGDLSVRQSSVIATWRDHAQALRRRARISSGTMSTPEMNDLCLIYPSSTLLL